MADLALEAIRKQFHGRSVAHLDAISLTVQGGEILAIVGPSAAGKTTLLRIVAGLDCAHSGRVLFEGRDVSVDTPQQRRFALLFQDDALLPMLTVRAQLEMVSRVPSSRMQEIVETLEIVALLPRRAGNCSGGERQRVALARALLAAPRAMLYDEPLAHVDPQGRSAALRHVMLATHLAAGPALYVTHDHTEAMTVGTTLAVLIDGKIEQIGAPQDVYDRPANIRVAKFLGEPPMNVSELFAAPFGMESVVVGFRAHHARIAVDGNLQGHVVGLTRFGSDVVARVQLDQELHVHVRLDAHQAPSIMERVGIAVRAEHLHRFDISTGVRHS